MKKYFIPLLTGIMLTAMTIDISADDPPNFGYVGTKACGMCHKSEKQGQQLVIWKESIHAQAYTVLESDAALKIAVELGYDKKPFELEECLICHASGYNVDKELLGKKFDIKDGVQCETCHGPGSEYSSIKVMKNRKEAFEKGLVNLFENKEELCISCHNPDSPTFTGFDFEEMWAKIDHYIPEKK